MARAHPTIPPARALARLMVASFVAMVMFLVVMVGLVGIADPSSSTGAPISTSAAAAP